MSNEMETEKKEKKQSSKEKLTTLQKEHEKLQGEYNRLKEELQLAKDAVKESMEMVKNFKLDVDRIKERSEELNASLNEKITMSVVANILPTIDNFEKALELKVDENILKGFKMIYLQLIKDLENMQVKRIEVKAGIFDPEKMEAIMTEATDNPQLVGTVSRVISTGYYYVPTDNVIRYTQVAVFN